MSVIYICVCVCVCVFYLLYIYFEWMNIFLFRLYGCSGVVNDDVTVAQKMQSVNPNFS